ncbi:MAG: site-specific integrase [bacterium]
MGSQSYRKQFVAFGHWLEKQEIVEKGKSPMEKVRSIKVPKEKPEDIPDIVIDKILASFDDSFIGVRDKTIFSWFLETGQRLGGVAGIKLAHFDWEKGVGVVTEKGNKERTIVISNALKTQVKKYMEMREPIARCEYLWINAKGHPLDNFEVDPPTYHGTYKIFADLNTKFRDDMVKYAPKEGQTIHPHAMRHVWAKHLAQAEVPLFSIMVMAGWENLALVQRYAAAYTQETAWKYINTASPLSKLIQGQK